jgi:hypothetical protein
VLRQAGSVTRYSPHLCFEGHGIIFKEVQHFKRVPETEKAIASSKWCSRVMLPGKVFKKISLLSHSGNAAHLQTLIPAAL